MGMQGVGAVLVMAQGRLEGIFTERDLVRALSHDIGAARARTRSRSVKIPSSLPWARSEEHTSELQSLAYLVCRLLLEKNKQSPTHRSCYVVSSRVPDHAGIPSARAAC